LLEDRKHHKFFPRTLVLFLFRLLVGAPLGKNLQPGTNHSGALYRCPVTTNYSDCEQVVTDGKRSKLVLAGLQPVQMVCPINMFVPQDVLL